MNGKKINWALFKCHTDWKTITVIEEQFKQMIKPKIKYKKVLIRFRQFNCVNKYLFILNLDKNKHNKSCGSKIFEIFLSKI